MGVKVKKGVDLDKVLGKPPPPPRFSKRKELFSLNFIKGRKSREVKPEDHLWLNNGVVIKSVVDLVVAIRSMDNKTFRSHVNKNKNDFAEWVRYIIKDDLFADMVTSAKSKKGFVVKMNEYINQNPSLKRLLADEEEKISREPVVKAGKEKVIIYKIPEKEVDKWEKHKKKLQDQIKKLHEENRHLKPIFDEGKKKSKELDKKEDMLKTKEEDIISKEHELKEKEAHLEKREKEWLDSESMLSKHEDHLKKRHSDIKRKEKELVQRESDISQYEKDHKKKIESLDEKEKKISEKAKEHKENAKDIGLRESELEKKEKQLEKREKELASKLNKLEKKEEGLSLKEAEHLENLKQIEKSKDELEELEKKRLKTPVFEEPIEEEIKPEVEELKVKPVKEKKEKKKKIKLKFKKKKLKEKEIKHEPIKVEKPKPVKPKKKGLKELMEDCRVAIDQRNFQAANHLYKQVNNKFKKMKKCPEKSKIKLEIMMLYNDLHLAELQ